MQYRKRDPKNTQSEQADHAADGVRKGSTPGWTRAFWRVCVFLVYYFIKAVKNAPEANNHVSEETLVRSYIVAFRWAEVAVCYYSHTDSSERNRDHLQNGNFFVKENNGESVGEESGAVIDCSELRGRGHIDCVIP